MGKQHEDTFHQKGYRDDKWEQAHVDTHHMPVSCTSEHVSQRNEIHTKTWARMVVAVLFVKTESYSQPNIH